MNYGKEEGEAMAAKTIDKDLLELAAKAAGIPIIPCTCGDQRWPFKHDEAVSGKHGHWSPFFDDGDALRLAVKLDIHVLRFENMTTAQPLSADWGCDERDDGDSCAATRRAIVRAAAEIGKTMP